MPSSATMISVKAKEINFSCRCETSKELKSSHRQCPLRRSHELCPILIHKKSSRVFGSGRIDGMACRWLHHCGWGNEIERHQSKLNRLHIFQTQKKDSTPKLSNICVQEQLRWTWKCCHCGFERLRFALDRHENMIVKSIRMLESLSCERRICVYCSFVSLNGANLRASSSKRGKSVATFRLLRRRAIFNDWKTLNGKQSPTKRNRKLWIFVWFHHAHEFNFPSGSIRSFFGWM